MIFAVSSSCCSKTPASPLVFSVFSKWLLLHLKFCLTKQPVFFPIPCGTPMGGQVVFLHFLSWPLSFIELKARFQASHLEAQGCATPPPTCSPMPGNPACRLQPVSQLPTALQAPRGLQATPVSTACCTGRQCIGFCPMINSPQGEQGSLVSVGVWDHAGGNSFVKIDQG